MIVEVQAVQVFESSSSSGVVEQVVCLSDVFGLQSTLRLLFLPRQEDLEFQVDLQVHLTSLLAIQSLRRRRELHRLAVQCLQRIVRHGPRWSDASSGCICGSPSGWHHSPPLLRRRSSLQICCACVQGLGLSRDSPRS